MTMVLLCLHALLDSRTFTFFVCLKECHILEIRISGFQEIACGSPNSKKMLRCFSFKLSLELQFPVCLGKERPEGSLQ